MSRNHPWPELILAIAGVSVLGCVPSPREQAEAFSKFVDNLCEAECVRDARCEVVSSRESCMEGYCTWSSALESEETKVRHAILAGRLKFDDAGAAQLTNLIREAPCSDPRPFVPFVYGMVEEGGACYLPAEGCREGLYCDLTEQCGGQCRPARIHGPGRFSPYTRADQCQRGLWALMGDALTCYVPGTEGVDCREAECAAPFYCTPDTQVCTRRPKRGEACGPNGVCEMLLTCAAGICEVPGGKGDSCAAGCQWDLICRALPGAVARTCEPRPRAGEPCDPTMGCDLGFYCVQGLCEQQLGEGARCEPAENQGHCLYGLTCSPSRSTCVAVPEEDEPCENVCGQSQQCIDGKCRFMEC
ncbi:MAG: hypothetical protein QM765_31340 [Myxococcales bacterium]